MESRFEIRFDQVSLAKAFGVTLEDVREYLTDGRRASFIIERRLKWSHPGWELAPSEGAGYDLRAPDGGLWEVRSITQGGVYFNPSAQVGSGRKFQESGFLAKLDTVAGFILSDITLFPNIPVFKVPVEFVKRWYGQQELNANAKVSRDAFYRRLLPQLPC
jgi:hypothetical protein